jgi:hypothetical protein
MSPLPVGVWAKATADAMNSTAIGTAIFLKSEPLKLRMSPHLMKSKRR